MSDKKLSPPFRFSYWVIPGKFLAGFYPGSGERQLMEDILQKLTSLGVSSIINLMEPDETDTRGQSFALYQERLLDLSGRAGREIVLKSFPVVDYGVPSPGTMKRILDEIDGNLEAWRLLYLHCWGGCGRTGTVVGCYMKRHGVAGEKVLEEIDLRRSRQGLFDESPETPVQKRFVLGWKKGD